MTESNSRMKESLSALMDDASNEMEMRRLLKDVEEGGELRDTWHRYQLARTAMRRELPDTAVDLSGAIASAIEEEAAHSQGFGRFLKPLSRVAVAASVTVVAVLGAQQYSLNVAERSAEAPVVAATAESEVAAPLRMPDGFQLPPVATRAVSSNGRSFNRPAPRQLVLMGQPTLDPVSHSQVQAYFDNLMKRHTEQAALGNNQGMLPFARMPQQTADQAQ